MSTSHTTPDYEAKIAALLAKAEGTDNPHEREAYSRKAERLMVKWGIDEAVARAKLEGKKGQPAEKIVEHRVEVRGRMHQAEVDMAFAVARGLGNVRVLKQGSYKGSTSYVYFIGHESDVQRIEQLYASLRLQANSARRAWWRTAPERQYLSQWQSFAAQRQFVNSFGYEVGRRLRAMHKEEVQEASTGTELVLLDRNQRVNAWLEEKYPKLGKARGHSTTWHGANEGRAAGARADIGQGRVGTGRAGELQ